LPPALDFFKYAKGGHKGVTNTPPAQVHADSDETDDEERLGQKRRRKGDDSDQEGTTSAPVLRHRVTTKGLRVPARADTFEEMEDRFKLPPYIMQNIRSCNYIEPTAVQQVGIPILAEGRDVAAISPTGTGKTLAYLLPLFSRLEAPFAKANAKSAKGGVRGLILAPTRELAAQIYNEAQKLAQGRKWRIVLFSKAAAATLKDPAVRAKVGKSPSVLLLEAVNSACSTDIIISTPLRLVAALQADELQLDR
jgi:ATP-dependent RNA helicase DDX52/ROK1